MGLTRINGGVLALKTNAIQVSGINKARQVTSSNTPLETSNALIANANVPEASESSNTVRRSKRSKREKEDDNQLYVKWLLRGKPEPA